MGAALQVILAVKQNLTGGGFENLTPGDGDSFTVRAFEDGSRAFIEEIWGLDSASAAQLSIKSPRMHDQTRGILLAIPDGSAGFAPVEEPSHLLPGYLQQEVYQSDALSVQVSGTAADDVLAAFLVRYDNLRGADASLHAWGEVWPLVKNLVGVLVQPTNGNGDYGTPVAINSVDDRLKADTDYAILGAVTDVATGLIAISGPDFSNYRIGMPGKIDPEDGGSFFVDLSNKYQIPHIPVFNANNKGNTMVTTADATTGGSPNITILMAELSARLTRRA
jgi:hypothetical protein